MSAHKVAGTLVLLFALSACSQPGPSFQGSFDAALPWSRFETGVAGIPEVWLYGMEGQANIAAPAHSLPALEAVVEAMRRDGFDADVQLQSFSGDWKSSPEAARADLVLTAFPEALSGGSIAFPAFKVSVLAVAAKNSSIPSTLDAQDLQLYFAARPADLEAQIVRWLPLLNSETWRLFEAQLGPDYAGMEQAVQVFHTALPALVASELAAKPSSLGVLPLPLVDSQLLKPLSLAAGSGGGNLVYVLARTAVLRDRPELYAIIARLVQPPGSTLSGYANLDSAAWNQARQAWQEVFGASSR